MLRLHPEKRAKASELVHHAWLDSIVVQGELDVIREAEAEDVRRRIEGDNKPALGAQQDAHAQREMAGNSSNSKRRSQVVDKAPRLQHVGETSEAAAVSARRETEEERQLEWDAMKPVDEDVSPDPAVDNAPTHTGAPPGPQVVRLDQPKKAPGTRQP